MTAEPAFPTPTLFVPGGLFIAFEGPEGGGKSTQARRLHERLRRAGIAALLTREPGGTAIGEQVRACLLSADNTAMRPRTELLLYCAARAQLVDEVLRPGLAAGHVVICDRYVDSTLAYQGYGHGLDVAAVERLLDFTTANLRPELTIHLDVPTETGLGRKQALGGAEWNRMDALAVDFHRRVRAGFQEIAARRGAAYFTLDATLDVEALAARVWERVYAILATRLEGLA